MAIFSKPTHRVTFLSSLGAGFEYYDFVIYGLLAQYIGPLFFPTDSHLASLIKAFSLFTLGYIARPIGGMLFGMLADRYGRRLAFTSGMFLMAFATLGMGLLPTAQQIGLVAPFALVILRILQGLAFGAELPGAITILSEFNETSKAGTHYGFLISSTCLGAMLATLVMLALTYFLNPSEISAWGWRLPFLGGGILAIVSYIIRNQIGETPAFQKVAPSPLTSTHVNPLVEVLKRYRLRLACGVLSNLFASSLILTNIFYPTYLKVYFPYSQSEIFQATTLSLIWCAIIAPCVGWITNSLGRKRLLQLALLSFIPVFYLSFQLLHTHSFWGLTVFMMINQLFISCSITSSLPLLAESFSTKVRFTATAIGYNCAYILASIIIYICLPSLQGITQTSYLILYLLGGISCCSFLATLSNVSKDDA